MNSWWRRFNSENLLMSIGGHLFLVAVMITSFALVLERAELVTPDRIQIMEIDLDNVKISGDETILRNVGTPTQAEEKPKPQKEPEPQPEPEPAEEAKPIETPTLVDEDKKDTPKEKADVQEQKADDKPVPKKKTVVRVNREVLSLDRTMTVSVVDALRVAMTRCWSIDTKRPDVSDIRAVAHLTMRKNGTVRDVWFESAARAETDPGFAYVLETIRDAINTCQPFKMLPTNEYAKWEKIQLTFYPTQGKVM